MVSLESLTKYIIQYSYFYRSKRFHISELGAVIYIINYVYKELKGNPLILEKPDRPHHDYFYTVYYPVVKTYGHGYIDYENIPLQISDFSVIRIFPQLEYVLDILIKCEPDKVINALNIIDGV